VCRDLAFRDVTVSVERLETTIMFHLGGSRDTNTTVFITANIYALMKIKQLTDKAK